MIIIFSKLTFFIYICVEKQKEISQDTKKIVIYNETSQRAFKKHSCLTLTTSHISYDVSNIFSSPMVNIRKHHTLKTIITK